LEKDEYSRGKGFEWEGKVYKTYDNWLDFSIDLADHYVFSNKYNAVLLARNIDEQLDILSVTDGYSALYCGILEGIIERYGLWEFDNYCLY
jgi:hypothetical protein